MQVCVAQVGSVFLNLEGSLAKGIDVIREAARGGAALIVFPEGFLPAHPVWYHFEAATSWHARSLTTELFNNSITVPGPEIEKLCDAARDAGISVVMGVCERKSGTHGTMFNTQLFIGSDGHLVGKHQKLTPTVGERLVHAGGFGDSLRGYGLPMPGSKSGMTVGGLICAENSNGLATAALDAEGVQLYASSWPPHFAAGGRSMDDIVMMASRSLSYRTGASVLSACGVITDSLIERVATTDSDREFFADRENGGGSCIIDAFTNVVAGPMPGAEEGLLTADLDLSETVRAKSIIDYSGHYNRADVFTLSVNRDAPVLVRDAGAVTEGAGAHPHRDDHAG